MAVTLTFLLLAVAAEAHREIPAHPASSATIIAQSPERPSPWHRTQGRVGVAKDTQIAGTIDRWRGLQRNDGLGFSAYAGFIMANPGWPGESRMRRLAETSIDPNSYDPGRVIAFFAQFPARTATGHARHAIALVAAGRRNEAQIAARSAWVGGSLARDDEGRLLSLFGSHWTTADHDQRTDMLLWGNDMAGAERMLAYVTPSRRPVYEARLAFRRKKPDAAARMQRAERLGAADAGYIADKANWLLNTGNAIAARQYLANRPVLIFRPGNAEKWYETLLTHARAAAKDSQWSFAYAIASKLDDAYVSGTDVGSRPIGERDDYTSLAWLAGMTAFYNLDKPKDAMKMFHRYATAAKSPQTRSKGFYWAGRAALQASKSVRASSYFAQASAFPRQFYGQLALEQRGRPIPVPTAAGHAIEISTAQRAAFANRSVVRAVKALGEMGYWADQSKFARAIANHAASAADYYLAAELAKTIGRPDMGVMAGRRAVSSGLSGYATSAFPRITVPSRAQQNWTMVHAIARQESQFDRKIVSRAGARGLMQLMPGTAREQAGRLGMPYTASSLDKPDYNILLGSSYFQRMLAYFDGSYPLAVAAYNAGPGNVNRWLRANGDPRKPGSDILRWIEQIPLFETRNYVQRVLENAVVYEAMNPAHARFDGSKTLLSKYLGKPSSG